MHAVALTASIAGSGETARGHAADRDCAHVHIRVPDAKTFPCTLNVVRRGEVLHIRITLAGVLVHLADIHVTDGLLSHAGRPPETRAHKFMANPPNQACQTCGHHHNHPIHSPELIANLWRATT